LVTALVGALLTAFGVMSYGESAERQAQALFDRHVERLESDINRRFVLPVYGLRGLRSLYETHEQVSRGMFREAMAAHDVAREFPGVRGLGFIEPVARGQLDAFTLRHRADEAPEFRVKTQGAHDPLYVIVHIEPFGANGPARGLDVGAEPVRREGVERAIQTGQPALTGRIVLVQDQRKGPGFLYLLPVFRKGAPQATLQERREALRGLLYAPIAVGEIMEGVAESVDSDLDFELFDDPSGDMGGLLYDHDDHLAELKTDKRQMSVRDLGDRRFRTQRVMRIGGRDLLLLASSTPHFDAVHDASTTQLAIAATGGVISALLASLVWLLGTAQGRAEAQAERMTVDLRLAKQQAEDALREHDALLGTLNQHSLVSFADQAGNIIAVNDAFCRVSGYAADELIGRNHRIVSSGRHSPFFWVEMWSQVSQGHTWRGEICNRARDGHEYWVDAVIAPVFNAQGEIEKYISIRNEITALKATEDELRKKDERLELALEGGNDGLWDWMDIHAQAEWWSPSFYRLLGYEPDEMEASLVVFDAMLHPDDRARTFAALERALSETDVYEALLDNRRNFDLEYRLRTKSGEYRWFRARAKVFFDEYGEPRRMAGSIQDIHDRRLAQDEIRARNEQLDAIFSLTPDAFISFDAAGRVSFASPAVRVLLGQEPAQLLGMTLQECADSLLPQGLSPQQHERLAGLWTTALPAASEPTRQSALSIELMRPTRCTLLVNLHRDTSQTTSAGVLHLRDVTHETEVDQMKSEFLSTAAHELRTPMSSIFGFTELLLTREMPPERQKQLLEKIYRQSQAMVAILNELLDLARIEARRGKDFTLESLDLAELLRDALRDFQPPAGREPVSLELPARDGLTARVDRSKMQQALRNLLSNAYKYSPEGGAVHARLALRRGPDGREEAGLQVQDHGIGLTREQAARVSERFYRADKSGAIPGTGLGMSIVREIVELLGGSLQLDSEYGQGTTVSLWLPLADGAHAALPAPDSAHTAADTDTAAGVDA
jgi:PAS domain S-box-containing protein